MDMIRAFVFSFFTQTSFIKVITRTGKHLLFLVLLSPFPAYAIDLSITAQELTDLLTTYSNSPEERKRVLAEKFKQTLSDNNITLIDNGMIINGTTQGGTDRILHCDKLMALYPTFIGPTSGTLNPGNFTAVLSSPDTGFTINTNSTQKNFKLNFATSGSVNINSTASIN